VISLDDMRIYQIASTSLRHALLFGRAHRRCWRRHPTACGTGVPMHRGCFASWLTL